MSYLQTRLEVELMLHTEAKWYLQVYTQIHRYARIAVGGERERKEGGQSHCVEHISYLSV